MNRTRQVLALQLRLTIPAQVLLALVALALSYLTYLWQRQSPSIDPAVKPPTHPARTR